MSNISKNTTTLPWIKDKEGFINSLKILEQYSICHRIHEIEVGISPWRIRNRHGDSSNTTKDNPLFCIYSSKTFRTSTWIVTKVSTVTAYYVSHDWLMVHASNANPSILGTYKMHRFIQRSLCRLYSLPPYKTLKVTTTIATLEARTFSARSNHNIYLIKYSQLPLRWANTGNLYIWCQMIYNLGTYWESKKHIGWSSCEEVK